MKRISIVTLAAALVLLSGCNKENNSSVDIDVDTSTDMQLIKLGGSTGAASAKTRASIESLAEMTGQMGVFCLAGRKTDIKNATNAKEIDWTTGIAVPIDDKNAGLLYGSTTNGRYWSNVCCEVNPEGDVYRITPTGTPNVDYYSYYPITSLYGYDFYGYYPYQNDTAKVHYTADSIYVDLQIWGETDVIYGQSEKIDTCVGKLTSDPALQKTLRESYYSARFFRKHPQKVDDARMQLNHKLARFCFFVYPGPDKEAAEVKTYDGARKLSVKEIKINQVETDLRLVVAHKTDESRNGALYAHSTNKEDFYLRNKNGVLLRNDKPVAIGTQTVGGVVIPDTTKLGDCIMLLPGKSVHYMSVKLFDPETKYEYPSESDIAISFKGGSGKKFEAGKTYNVYLQVSGIKDISITAELVEWEESGEEMDLIEFN